jgi:hypothetical protein
VIIHDFHVEGIALFPVEADSPLIIDPYAVLSGTVPAKHFETISWRHTEVIKGSGIVDHTKLSPGYLLDILRQSPRALSMPDLFGFLCPKTLNHERSIT